MSNRINRIFVYSFAQFINIFITFLLSPYLSRALEKNEYAVYNQVIYLGGFFTIVCSIGLFNTINFFFAKKDNQQERITIQSLITALGLAAALLFFLLSFFFNGQLLGQLLRLFAVSFIFSFVSNYLTAVLIIHNHTRYVALCTVLITIASSAGLLVAIQKFHSIQLAFFITGIVMPALNFIILFAKARQFVFFKFSLAKAAIKNIFRVSGPLYMTNILGATYTYAAAFFVNVFAGSIAFANYKNGAIELPFISSIAYSVSAVVMPDLAKMYQERKLEEIYVLKKKMINQVICIIYPVVFYFLVFHYEFITAYFSPKYSESALIFAIYTCTCFIRINDYQDVLVASGNSKYILRSNLYYAALNIVLVIIMGYFFKGAGIAAASFVSVVFLAWMLLKYDSKVLSKKWLEFFDVKNILKLSLFCLGLLLAIYAGSRYLKLNSVTAVIYSGLLYFPVVYFVLYKFNFYDRKLVTSLTSKIPGLKKIAGV